MSVDAGEAAQGLGLPMKVVRRLARWMFEGRRPGASWWQVILWWEARRIPYNLLVGAWGLLCLLVYYVALQGAGGLDPGEDAVEPLALMVAPVVINLLYTLGWLVELPLRAFGGGSLQTERLGPRLLKLGVVFSFVVASLPAGLWLITWAARSVPELSR